MTFQLRGLHEELRPYAEYALDLARYYNIPVTITSVVRGWAEQTRLRDRYESCLARGELVHAGNSNPSCRYPANRPGDSAHNYGVAWDSWVPPEHRDDWIRIRRWIGWEVPESDWIHAQLPNWRAYTDQLTIHR